MTLRELQADFASGNTQGTSFSRRPDAVSRDYLTAVAPGPRALSDPTEGLLAKGWYARADNGDGKVYLSGSRDDTRLGWETEEELFTYSGADIVELDLCFDQNGAPLIVTERAGHVWIRYYDPGVPGWVFEDFGVGINPRCILDDPINSSTSDMLVFYIRDGKVRYREQNDLYDSEGDTGAAVTADQYLEGTIRDGEHRIHVVLSTRDTGDGTYALSRLTSELYPIPMTPEGLALKVFALTGTVTLVILEYDMSTEEISIEPSAIAGTVLEVIYPESMLDEFDFEVEVSAVSVIDTVIDYEPDPEELDILNTAIAGTILQIVIHYEPDPEEIDVVNSAIAGTIVVP